MTVKQVARSLGICPKTLSTVWVRRGVLTPLLSTVGQGRAMLFDPDRVQAFKDNADLAEFLALCRWGWQCGKLDNRPAGYFGEWKRRNGQRVFKSWEDFFGFRVFANGERRPHGWQAMPDEVTNWARAAAITLTRREVEYLCAIFLASIKPDNQYNDASFYAAAKDLPLIVKKLQSLENGNTLFGQFIIYLKEAGSGSALELKYAMGLSIPPSQESTAIMAGASELRKFFIECFPEDEAASMFRRLCAHSRMDEARQKKAGGFPSFAIVGRLMNIQRAQAGQLGKGALKKLHRAGLYAEMAGLFGVHSATTEPAPVVDDDAAFWEERTASI